MYMSLINVHFKFYVQGYCCIKIQNNVFGKYNTGIQEYNTTLSGQEKHQRAES